MASRPENIGIKAIEIYFPSQVSLNRDPRLSPISLPPRPPLSPASPSRSQG